MAAKGNSVKRDLISATIQARLDSLKRGNKVIQGSLTVASGHDYWWFLEYGTGQYHDTPEGDLNEPPGVEGYSAEGGPYEIEVTKKKYLVYMLKTGERRRAAAVTHPGVSPIGFVRTALFDAEIYLKAQLTRHEKRRKKLKELPGREELVNVVNRSLEVLLKDLRALTPPDSDPDPYHKGRNPVPLAEAWGIKKAK